MIFDEIVLHNFGVYRGRQVIDLSPPSAEKPVILFGGLNGAGKTTLLDALQLALYGKLARCSNRGTLAYDEYLQRAIHQDVDRRDGAAVELQFRHTVEGEHHTYRVHRSWHRANKTLREKVEVLRNGEFDPVVTDAWQEQVEEFIPNRISHLFFFDGEKIKRLASLENSSELLQTAFQSLLGLDIVDQLSLDLLTLERRKRGATRKGLALADLQKAKEEADKAEARRLELREECASSKNLLERTRKEVREISRRVKSGGGDLFAQREELEQQQKALKQQLGGVEDQMRRVASGPAPLMMVVDLLKQIATQDDKESELVAQEEWKSLLERRDKCLLAALENKRVPKAVIAIVAEFFENDRKTRAVEKKEMPLDLSAEARRQLTALRGGLLEDVSRQVVNLVEEHRKLRRSLTDVGRKISSVPEEDAIADLLEQRGKALERLRSAEQKMRDLEEEYEVSRKEAARTWFTHESLLLDEREIDLSNRDRDRMVRHSERVRQTLGGFRRAVVERHIERLERLVFESIRRLMRKDCLVTSIRIHPDSFDLSIFGRDGLPLAPDRLSAGERQILAVSLLWGLAQASGRPLPAVIDTPLGRLDSSHREQLVQRYFPYASHQVLLLSTDEEIDDAHFQKLRSRVGRSYRLDFDDSANSTTVQAGYFW
jgi:DNA sulfur modification protein DndD